MRSITTLSCFLLWAGGLIVLPHSAPFYGGADWWLWWVFSIILAITSVTDLIWRQIARDWPRLGLMVSAAVGLGGGLFLHPRGWEGLIWTVGLGLFTLSVLWLIHARLAAGDWWIIGLGAVSLAGHPAYFGLWIGLSLALAWGVHWGLFHLQHAAEPLPFLPLALVGDLLARFVWSWR